MKYSQGAQMVFLHDLPTEVQAYILSYPVTCTFVETLLQSKDFQEMARVFTKHLSRDEREELYISSKELFKFPHLESITGYRVAIESLDDLIDVAIEKPMLTHCEFDISLLGLVDISEKGLSRSQMELRSRLIGKHFTSLKTLFTRIKPNPSITQMSLNPDDVVNYITHFILYSTLLRSNTCTPYKYRFWSRHRFFLEISNGSLQVTPNGYIDEICNIVDALVEVAPFRSFTGILASNTIVSSLLEHLPHLEEIRIYAKGVSNLLYIKPFLDKGLRKIGLAHCQGIKRDIQGYIGNVREFLEGSEQYPLLESFLPIPLEDISLLLSKFPGIKEVECFSLSLKEVTLPCVEGVKINLI